jgi:hypothetical protein
LLTMLVLSAAGLAACDRRLRAKPGVERPLEGSWSDGAIIPRSARCLLDGFDPSGTLLLFSCRNRISGCFTPIRGNSASGRFELGDRRRWEAVGVRGDPFFSS